MVVGINSIGIAAVILIETLGVVIFFVHAALVLMSSLERQTAVYGDRSIWSVFLVGMAFSFSPLSVVAILLTILLCGPGGHLAKDSLTTVPVTRMQAAENVLRT